MFVVKSYEGHHSCAIARLYKRKDNHHLRESM